MATYLRWLAFAGILIATVGLRLGRIDDDFARRRRESDVRDLIKSPGPDQMRALSVQHPLALADLFWLSAVQEIGRFIERKEPQVVRLKNWANLATDLDPRYFQAYYAVAVNLTVYNKDAEGSDRLLEKGQKHLPERWQFPFMRGYNAYFLRGDLRRASELWTEAAYFPDAPRYVPSLAARSKFQSGDERQAEALLLTMLEHLEGEHKRDALIRLNIIRSEPILRAYDEACRRYVAKMNEHPASAAALRVAGYVNYPPEDMFGKLIELDDKCRARTAMITVREDEAVKRAGSESAQASSGSSGSSDIP